ncbi:hypothetical protein BBD42_14505 [Paenibacillus sp. BIHB 4019]|uniref:DUF2264 domain-containing protein n=1 Tax=Paenibacillus sp. BIHB 4019 TaxID=1870819 RepID=A0A1B2DSQ6_9BACL|nr:hypothetical protein BBD42_14505 [Paenibacillus sp. BIHB 4019]
MRLAEERKYWVSELCRVAEPVLRLLAARELKKTMPVQSAAGQDRSDVTHLEALGRLLCGIAPWLEGSGGADEEEERLRQQYAELSRGAIAAGCDPESPDYMNFAEGYQPIVDTAFLAQAILRAPTELWDKLDAKAQKHVVQAFKLTRSRKPFAMNWLLFSAIIEAALYRMGESDWDPMRIDYALKQHEQWYVGDGAYGDGPSFHFDYYNSFVIQPMLVDIVAAVQGCYEDWDAMHASIKERAKRWAEVQERLISPEGTFPPLGRSLAYRCGAMQSLAQSALLGELPSSVTPAQARCALTAVIRRSLSVPGTFTADGWLTIGFCGSQPNIGEHYISTGSLYLCAAVFLPLGLAAEHPFWSGEPEDWTARKAWSGSFFTIDHALKG